MEERRNWVEPRASEANILHCAPPSRSCREDSISQALRAGTVPGMRILQSPYSANDRELAGPKLCSWHWKWKVNLIHDSEWNCQWKSAFESTLRVPSLNGHWDVERSWNIEIQYLSWSWLEVDWKLTGSWQVQLVADYLGHQRKQIKQKKIKWQEGAEADESEFVLSLDGGASLFCCLPHRGSGGQGVKRLRDQDGFVRC